MAINWSRLKGDVTPYSELMFPVAFGIKQDNAMFNIVRHAWENQSVDVHQQTLYKVMNEMLKFKVELNPHGLVSYIRIKSAGDAREPVKLILSVESHLLDFDMMSNSDFSGLDVNRGKTPISPKSYSGSPLIVSLRCYNTNWDDFKLMKESGFFFIRGDGEIDYVQYFDVATMQDKSYGILTDFKVNQLCWLNHVDGSEQVLYKL